MDSISFDLTISIIRWALHLSATLTSQLMLQIGKKQQGGGEESGRVRNDKPFSVLTQVSIANWQQRYGSHPGLPCNDLGINKRPCIVFIHSV